MGILEFIVGMTKAIAWPCAIAWITWSLKDEFAQLLRRMTKAKHGNTEIEFAEKLEELENAATTSGEQLRFNEADRAQANTYNAIKKMAEISPRAAIIEAYHFVEAAKKELLKKADADKLSIHERKLFLREALSATEMSLLEELRRLRNNAVHSEDFSLHGMYINQYVSMALALARSLEEKRL